MGPTIIPTGSAHQHALELLAALDSAGHVVDHIAQRHAERDFINARIEDIAAGVKILVPLVFSVPMPQYQSAPFTMMCGTAARVSTLLMTVGLPM